MYNAALHCITHSCIHVSMNLSIICQVLPSTLQFLLPTWQHCLVSFSSVIVHVPPCFARFDCILLLNRTSFLLKLIIPYHAEMFVFGPYRTYVQFLQFCIYKLFLVLKDTWFPLHATVLNKKLTVVFVQGK